MNFYELISYYLLINTKFHLSSAIKFSLLYNVKSAVKYKMWFQDFLQKYWIFLIK